MGASLLAVPFSSAGSPSMKKKRVALVGTGVRGVRMFGVEMLGDYSETVDLVGICDINPGRVAYAREYIGIDIPTFTDIDEMLAVARPETLLVTSRDDVHHEHIIKGLAAGCDVICEKPMTIDEEKAQAILDAERKYRGKVIITFNYRYPPYRARIKKMIMEGLIGDIEQVEFHWNISHSHMMRYMQRWHGHQKFGGSLWVHKSTHHFDMVNWYLDSDPAQVYAYGSLERFGKNGGFRGKNCRDCAHKAKCPYHWDITENEHLYRLYTENEHHDGYIRDNCVFREDIDIFDRQVALVKYANGTLLNYSLSSNSEYEGYWMALNGTRGRLEVRTHGYPERDFEEIILTPNRRFSSEDPRIIRVQRGEGGHWGGDPILTDQLFKDPNKPDPLGQQAGIRDGAMSILVGIAARKSIVSGLPVNIKGLTDLVPQAKRPAG